MNVKKATFIVVGIIACIVSVGCKSNVTDMPILLKEPQGIIVKASYTGETVLKVPNGMGTVTGVDTKGDPWVYEGEMKDGQINGQGKKTWENGVYTEEGIFENNVFVNGKIFERGHLAYEGELKDTWPARPTVFLNTPVKFGYWEYTVVDKEIATVAGKVETKNKFIILTLDVKNIDPSRSYAMLGRVEFVLLDNRHRAYELNYNAMTSLKVDVDPSLGDILTLLQPGETRKMKFVFEVPDNAHRMKLIPLQGFYTSTYIDVGDVE